MGKSLILAVKIIGDANSAIAAMDQVAGKSGGMGRALDTASKWSVAALAGITGAAIACGAAASDLEQATGAVKSVFGEYANEMLAYGEQAADAIGLSQAEYGNMASVLGAQLKNMGLSLEETAGQTNDLMGLGADLAATFGGTTSEAVSALSSLLRGERDPIEKYGVSIKQADIDAQKAAMGLSGLTGEAARNADLQATLALLTAQTADAQGQFAREADSAAGSAQVASANFENAKAALGEQLLPIMTEAAQMLSELAGWFQENAEWVTPLVGVIAALAAGIVVMNAAYKAYVAVQAMQTAAQWANNAAWLASPITWIILAIIAAIALLVAGIVWVVQHWDELKAAAVLAWETIVGWVQTAIEWVRDRIAAAVVTAAAVWVRIQTAAAAVWQAVIQWVENAIAPIRDGVANAIQTAVNWFFSMRDQAVGALDSIIAWVRNLLSWLGNLASKAIPGWAKDLLGMSSRSLAMPITPEVASLTPSDYQARMLVTPQLASFAAPAYEVATPAPIAQANLGAMVALTSLVLPALAPSKREPAQAVYEDHSEHHYHFPNYLGDRDEIIDEIEEAMEKRKRRRGGVVEV